MSFCGVSSIKFLGLTVILSLVLAFNVPVGFAQLAQDKPFVIDYYYKVKWGYADEFIRLFKKNHYPFLKKQIELKNALEVSAEAPIHHSNEADRWDYRVRVVWKNVQIAHEDSGDEAIFKQLFPNQEVFKREEQRRFEILLGHWDVPVRVVSLEDKN